MSTQFVVLSFVHHASRFCSVRSAGGGGLDSRSGSPSCATANTAAAAMPPTAATAAPRRIATCRRARLTRWSKSWIGVASSMQTPRSRSLWSDMGYLRPVEEELSERSAPPGEPRLDGSGGNPQRSGNLVHRQIREVVHRDPLTLPN